ncbi:tetratricopeptide repeat protein [Photobacterium nomapromontoriensis]|uniref:tetratricopeptide repeat protein n=1 Tax=Photobacterium nomapromontoriensis TaxID=2910237 RepID=UPI003D122440
MDRVNYFVLPLLLLMLSACSQHVGNHNDIAIAEMEKAGNTQGMIAYYKSELQTDSDNPSLYQKIAQLYYSNHDLESAEFYANHSQKIAEPDQHLFLLMGKIYDDSGKYTDALEAFDQSELQGNSSAELYISRGIVLSKLGQYLQAEEQFNTARLNGYNDIAVKNNLAVLYLLQRRYAEAADILLPLLPYAKDNQRLKVNLSIALIKVGDKERAYHTLKDLYNDEQLRVLFQLVKDMEQV